MEEESTKNRKAFSRPLRPEDIPTRASPQISNGDARKIEEFSDILDIEPKEGFFFYIKIPSIIFLGTVSGYIIGKFNFAIFYLVLVAYAVYFIYNRKVVRFTRSLKSLVYHNVIKEKARCNVETVEWLNFTVKKFWEVAEPAVSAEVYQQVNTELLKVTPPFLNGLKLTEFTLGSRPPIIYGISFMDTNTSTIILETDVVFIPLETSKDALRYYEDAKRNWNTRIQLTARVGTKNGIGINLPILVKELSFSGKFRISLNLTPKKVFVKDVEVCLLEPPTFDFTLVPLKTVDLMDVPGLSRWIRSIIKQVLSTTLVNPKSIKVDVDKISQAQGKVIGVICLQLLNLENETDERLITEIDIDGKSLFQTCYREGREIVYNEHFYLIIESTDEKIGLSLHSDSKTSKRRNGAIFLRNLPLNAISENVLTNATFMSENKESTKSGRASEENGDQQKSKNQLVVGATLGYKGSKAYKKGEVASVSKERERILSKKEANENTVQYIRRTFFNKTRLVKQEQTYAYLNSNMQYYPILKQRTNSAIVTMHLIGIEDMRGNGSPVNQLYSSFCTIIVSPMNKESSTLPLNFIENTVNATALLVSGVINTAGNVINQIVPGMGSTSTKLLPASSSTFYVFESKKIFSSSSPLYNDQFVFFSRDILVDVVSICVVNEKNNEIIGRVSIPIKDITDGKKEKYRLKDAQNGRIEMFFDLSYVEIKDHIREFLNYTQILLFTVEAINETGVFYIVFSTSSESYTMEAFSSHAPIKKTMCIPLQSNDTVKFKLYKETTNGDIFIGEDSIDVLDDKPEAFLLNEAITLTSRIKMLPLKSYEGPRDDNAKVIQIRFGAFYNLLQEVYVEFYSRGEIIGVSGFSRHGKIKDVFTFVIGTNEIEAVIKNADQGTNDVISRFKVPKRMTSERMALNDKSLSVDIDVHIQSFDFVLSSTIKQGCLEVYIKNALNVKPVDGNSADPFCKVLVNGKKVYRTKSLRRTVSPIFNESFTLNVDRLKDLFCVQVCDYNTLEKNSLISFVEFSIHNLAEGFSELEFNLIDAKTFKETVSSIRVGFNFCVNHSSLKIKKRGVIGAFGF